MLHNSQVNILNVVVLYPALNIQIGITEISKIKTHLAWNVVTLLGGGLRATDTSLTILGLVLAAVNAVAVLAHQVLDHLDRKKTLITVTKT